MKADVAAKAGVAARTASSSRADDAGRIREARVFPYPSLPHPKHVAG